MFLDGPLNVMGYRNGLLSVACRAREIADHFIDRVHTLHMDHLLYSFYDTMMIFNVYAVMSFYQDQIRTHRLCIGYNSPGLHTKSFCFVRCCDRTRCIGNHRNNSDRSSTQRWVRLLLYRSEVGVEVYIQ